MKCQPHRSSPALFEHLEARRMLSAMAHMAVAEAMDAAPATVRAAAPHAARHRIGPGDADTVFLSVEEVRSILARAASQAGPGQVIAVADRDGNILGLLETAGMPGPDVALTRQLRTIKAIDQAVTAAFFASTQDAFTTRTARFIIQDHFPFPVRNTPGGPLYGVQFSSEHGVIADAGGFHSSDIYPKTIAGLSGDPGGVPLYKNGVPVGGIGAAGSGNEIAARADVAIQGDPDVKPGRVFTGREERSQDEAVAQAGAAGFMAPSAIRADQIFLDGLRLPFVAESAARAKPARTFDDLITSGAASVATFPGFFSGTPIGGSRNFAPTVLNGAIGEVRNPLRAGTEGDPAFPSLTEPEVEQIIGQAVRQASITRGAIREPIGVAARVIISVVDTQGSVLGSFRMQDATNFSYDISVQKARTALFFSTDSAALSSRAVGFLSQRFFPPGIDKGNVGPLYHLQNDLGGFNLVNPSNAPLGNLQPLKFGGVLANGITIFPGGFPLYKNGRLVGAIGISGDGVDQDDLIGYAGSRGFQPASHVLSDHLRRQSIVDLIEGKLPGLAALGVNADLLATISQRLRAASTNIRLPYVKFPRHPNV